MPGTPKKIIYMNNVKHFLFEWLILSSNVSGKTLLGGLLVTKMVSPKLAGAFNVLHVVM